MLLSFLVFSRVLSSCLEFYQVASSFLMCSREFLSFIKFSLVSSSSRELYLVYSVFLEFSQVFVALSLILSSMCGSGSCFLEFS